MNKRNKNVSVTFSAGFTLCHLWKVPGKVSLMESTTYGKRI